MIAQAGDDNESRKEEEEEQGIGIGWNEIKRIRQALEALIVIKQRKTALKEEEYVIDFQDDFEDENIRCPFDGKEIGEDESDGT